jgi:flagellar hook-length control protein FliK
MFGSYIVSALSITSVAAQGGNAQAPQQSGAPATDNSPFSILLAALTSANPDPQAVTQPDPAQGTAVPPPSSGGAPQTGAQTSATLVPQAPANDHDADQAAASDELASDSDASKIPLPGADSAPKGGAKPDKKADPGKAGTDDSGNPSPLQTQIPVLAQLPAMAAVQAAPRSWVTGDDTENLTPGLDLAAAARGANAAPQASDIPKAFTPAAPPPAPSARSDSSQASQPSGNADQVNQLAAASAASNGNEDGGGDDAIGALAAAFTAGRSGNPTQSRDTVPQQAPANDDADEALAADPTPPPQLTTRSEPAPTRPTPQKLSLNAPGQPAPGATVQLPPGTDPSTAKETAQTFGANPSPPADKSDSGKPMHGDTAQQPDAAPGQTPQPATILASQTAQSAIALDPGNADASGGANMTVHVASHDAESRQPASPSMTPNVAGLAISVAARSLSGIKQFDIRLDPPELGRVEVRLSIDASGKTQAHMTTDQPQTLALLQKDAPTLTRALRDAGLDVSQNGLNFSLRGQNQNQGGQSGNFGAPARGLALGATVQGIEAAQTAAALPSTLLGNARLDIHV